MLHNVRGRVLLYVGGEWRHTGCNVGGECIYCRDSVIYCWGRVLHNAGGECYMMWEESGDIQDVVWGESVFTVGTVLSTVGGECYIMWGESVTLCGRRVETYRM